MISTLSLNAELPSQGFTAVADSRYVGGLVTSDGNVKCISSDHRAKFASEVNWRLDSLRCRPLANSEPLWSAVSSESQRAHREISEFSLSQGL